MELPGNGAWSVELIGWSMELLDWSVESMDNGVAFPELHCGNQPN